MRCNLCDAEPARTTAAGPRCAQHDTMRNFHEGAVSRHLVEAPPRQPATEVPPDSPGVPDKARRMVDAAKAVGWWWSLTRAETHDGRHLLCLRARNIPFVQVAVVWEWIPPHWTKATKTRAARWVAEPEWKNTDAWIHEKGRLTGLATHTEVMQRLRDAAGG